MYIEEDRDLNVFYKLSGRRGSNSRPIAWKAIALPTELLPPLRSQSRKKLLSFIDQRSLFLVEGEGFEPSKPKQRIYSPSHLTALEPLQTCSTCYLLSLLSGSNQ